MNRWFALVALLGVAGGARSDPPYADEIEKWREGREKSLRADNGWLTLAGRYPLKAGANTFGVAADNDVVFPALLKGIGPGRLGTLVVDADAKTVTLKLAEGVAMVRERDEGKTFTGERVLEAGGDKRDWVGVGRMRMHVIERDGRFILRLADNESPVRQKFAGRLWYPVDETFKVQAKFLPAAPGKTLRVVNILDEVSLQPCPGSLEFKLAGQTHTLDAIADGKALLIVFRDRTAGDTTYGASRFLTLDERPKDNETVTLDFNKAFNPPCAFSDFTTCPLPPPQNVLKVRVDAGEKYRGK